MVFFWTGGEDSPPSGQRPMTNKISLVLATHNEGKRREYARLFKDVPVEVRMLSEFDGLPEVIE